MKRSYQVTLALALLGLCLLSGCYYSGDVGYGWGGTMYPTYGPTYGGGYYGGYGGGYYGGGTVVIGVYGHP